MLYLFGTEEARIAHDLPLVLPPIKFNAIIENIAWSSGSGFCLPSPFLSFRHVRVRRVYTNLQSSYEYMFDYMYTMKALRPLHYLICFGSYN